MRAHPALLAFVFATSILSSQPADAARTSAPRTPVAASPSLIDNDDRMDVNNLDMAVTNHGSFAYDLLTGNAGLVYPKGTGRTAVFASGLWIGARVFGGVRVAIGEYSQEFTPGPMANGTFMPDQPEFRNFKFDRSHPLAGEDLVQYVSQGGPTDGSGNALLLGDATIWSVFNDADPAVHWNRAGMTPPLGLEVQQTVYAYNRSGALGNMIFMRWKLLNKNGNPLESTYVSLWSDPDLGGFTDDLVGCDTTLALGYCYNATNADAQYGSSPPAVGFMLLRGPVVQRSPGVHDTLGMTSFNRYINGTDPTRAEETYFYMLGLDREGQDVHVFDDPSLPITTYLVSGLNPGAPSSPTNWLDSNPADRRLMISSGPFTMEPGETQEIRAVLIVGQGSDRISSINDLKSKAVVAMTFIEPEPPPPLPATVDLEPGVLSRLSHAPWVTAYVESDAFAVEDIQPSSVRLAGSVPADPKWAVVGDHDGDGAPDLALKFARALLVPLLAAGNHRLTLAGSLSTGARFAGQDDVRVIDPPAHPPLASVAPNPLNPAGTLRFETTRPGAARIRIFDVTGRLVRTVSHDALPAGRHALPIGAERDGGSDLVSGVYLFRLETAEGVSSGRFVVLK